MRAWLPGALGALGVCVWLVSARQPVATVVTVVSPASPATATTPAGEAPLLDVMQPPEALARGMPASLRDTVADGGWRADARGHLVIERAVRRRFDYWLSAIGELQPAEISAQVMASARRELPSFAVAQLEMLWTHYLELQRHAWLRAAQPADPATWRAALEERQLVRRLLLGREAAEAFYADEEQALWADVLAWESGRAVSPKAQAAQVPEHPQAVQRVADVEAQWAQWERRLDEARAEVARLQAARELSEPQREQAVQAWLFQRFTRSEQLRVRALLGLAPS